MLKRRFQFTGTGTSTASPEALHFGSRIYRLYRNEFEATDGAWERFMCRSQNPNRAENSTDVGDSKDVMKGEDNVRISSPSLVGVTTNGVSTVHVNNGRSSSEESEEDVVVATAASSRSWWDSIPRRYIIVGLCFIAFLLCNMDRVCGFFLLLSKYSHAW